MSIKTTSRMKEQIKSRCKLLFGKPVIIGQVYSGATAHNGKVLNTELKALTYDNGKLLLSSMDSKYFVFLTGDIAAFRNRIIADSVLTSINFNHPITAKTELTGLESKYHYVPPRLLEMIIKGVTE